MEASAKQDKGCLAACGMTALSSVARIFLLVINFLFLLLGVGLLIVGLVLRFAGNVVNLAMEQVGKNVKTSAKFVEMDNLDHVDVDYGEIGQGLYVTFIIFGLIISTISVIGYLGAFYKLRVVLLVYAGIGGLVVLGEVIAVSVLYGDPDITKKALKTSLHRYKSLGSSESTSFTWNVIMAELQCCGVDSYRDFQDTEWNNTTEGKANGTLMTPLACCKTLPNSKDFSCANTTHSSVNNAETGCFQKLWDATLGNKGVAVGLVVAVIFVQILMLTSALVMFKSSKSAISPM